MIKRNVLIVLALWSAPCSQAADAQLPLSVASLQSLAALACVQWLEKQVDKQELTQEFIHDMRKIHGDYSQHIVKAYNSGKAGANTLEKIVATIHKKELHKRIEEQRLTKDDVKKLYQFDEAYQKQLVGITISRKCYIVGTISSCWQFVNAPVSVRDFVEANAVPSIFWCAGACMQIHEHITHLEGIEEVPGAEDVEYVCFDNSYIETIPEGLSLSRYLNLKSLDLSRNRIVSLPSLVLPFLKSLNLKHNKLQEFNSAHHDLRNIEKLFLSHNKIRKIFPIELDCCYELDLENNRLESLPRIILSADLDSITFCWRDNPLLSLTADFDQSRLPAKVIHEIKDDIKKNWLSRGMAKTQAQLASYISFCGI